MPARRRRPPARKPSLRQRDGVDLFDHVDGIEKRAFAGAGAAAAHVHGCDRRPIEHHRGDTRGQRLVIGMADANPRNIREKIFHRHSPNVAHMKAGRRPGQPCQPADDRASNRSAPAKPGRSILLMTGEALRAYEPFGLISV
jgi:hypothetical protein